MSTRKPYSRPGAAMAVIKPRKKRRGRAVPPLEIPQFVPRRGAPRPFSPFSAALVGGILGGLVVLLAGRHFAESRPGQTPPVLTTPSRAPRTKPVPKLKKALPAVRKGTIPRPTATPETEDSRVL